MRSSAIRLNNILEIVSHSIQSNLEQRGRRWRLRYQCQAPSGGPIVRLSMAIPSNPAWLSEITKAIDVKVRQKREAKELVEQERQFKRALGELRRKVLTRVKGGRVVKNRVGKAFDVASRLGADTLKDFIDHQPWLATPHKPGPGGRVDDRGSQITNGRRYLFQKSHTSP